jgi:dihydrofolate reductase
MFNAYGERKRFSLILRQPYDSGVFMKVILLMAITLDGRTGKGDNHFVDWTDKEDKRIFIQITKKAGVVIMGSRTFDTLGKPLDGRRNIIMTRNASRKSHWENLAFTDKSPESILNMLEQEGFSEAVLAGGPTVNSLFARKNLIDEIIVTISPLVFGFGTSLFTEDIGLQLALLETRRAGETLIFARYRVER